MMTRKPESTNNKLLINIFSIQIWNFYFYIPEEELPIFVYEMFTAFHSNRVSPSRDMLHNLSSTFIRILLLYAFPNSKQTAAQ